MLLRLGLFILIGSLFLSPLRSWAQLRVELQRQGQPQTWPMKSKAGMLSVAPNSKAYFMQVVIDLPQGVTVQSVEGDDVMSKPEWMRPNRIKLGLGRIRNELQVQLANGSTETWILEVKGIEKTLIRANSCQSLGLKVKARDPSAKMYFVAECVAKEDKIYFNPSVPGDASWTGSTLFESSGKGERWKLFEISNTTTGIQSDIVATMDFEIDGKKSQFLLLQDRRKAGRAPEKPEDKWLFNVGVGMTQVKGETPVSTAAGSLPALAVSALSPKLYSNFRGEASLNLAIPSETAGYSQAVGGIGPTWGELKPGGKLWGLFAEFATIQQSGRGDGKTMSFQHGNAGVAAMGWIGTESSEFTLGLRYTGFSGTSTGTEFLLGYGSQGPKRWTVQAGVSNQTAKSTTGQSTFSQTSFLLGWNF